MADRDSAEMEGRGCFKEAVCIDATRIYDSCSDKDCLEDMRVYFTTSTQEVINAAASVRIRDVEVISVYMDLQPIPFNRGFYSVDMTFFFDICLDVFGTPLTGPTIVNGVCVFNKKVILYGSEGSVKVFSSDETAEISDPQRSMPRAIIQVAEPVPLTARLCEGSKCCDICCTIPDSIVARYGEPFVICPQQRTVYATIGMFTIIQIVRNVQMLIPAYDFCVPEKECVASSDNPCEVFRRIDFPTNEFFPPKVGDLGTENCGCQSR